MLVLIDGSNLLHRVMSVPALLERQPGVAGKFGGVSGFLTILRRTIKNKDASRCIVVWDSGLSERRVALYKEYKAHRASRNATDPELIAKRRRFAIQLRYLNVVLPLLGVTVLDLEGKEGDDVIWYARAFGIAYGHKPCVIVSEDLDFSQMVDTDTTLYRPVRDMYLNSDNFEVHVGIPRDRFLLYKAICGDVSDGIRGVRGAGESTARRIALDSPTTEWDGVVEFCLRSKERRIRRVGEGIDIIKRNFELVKLGLEVFTQPELKYLGDKVAGIPKSNMNEALDLVNQFKFDGIARDFHDWSLPFYRIGVAPCRE